MSLAAVLLVRCWRRGPAPTPPVYFEQTTVARSPARPRGPGVTARVWYAGARMRLEPGHAPAGTALVLRLDEGRAWRLDPARKQAIALDLDRLRDQSQMDVSMAGQLMGVGDGRRAHRGAAGEGRRRLPCSGYRLTAGLVRAGRLPDAAASERASAAFTDFLEWSGASQSMAGLIDALRKLPGFPLEMRSRVDVLGEIHETVSPVANVKVGPLADALFAPPAGWAVVPESQASWENEGGPMGILIGIVCNAIALYLDDVRARHHLHRAPGHAAHRGRCSWACST